jgi:hypothetical protein
MSTYLAHTALEQLDAAQAEIDAHVHAYLGFCAACGEKTPCSALLAASAIFARYHQLPRRRPGLAMRGVSDER